MTVTDVVKDPDNRTMTITAEFAAPVERVWQIWADPRQLERWWGPPTYPATVVDHDLSEGGGVNYFMTGPEGDKHAGWWRVSAVVPPRRLEFEDGFADEAGKPSSDMPVTVICVTLDDRDGGGTRMEITSTFATVEAMQQLLAMGMDEGMKAAMGQIDEILG
jgi:uncharacterized protein YndB with AHSA1/START domain